MYINFFKPIIDFISSLFGLFLVFPILLVFSLLLLISNSGNPFFVQVRPGKNEKLFHLIKFKTMIDARDQNGKLLPDKERVTKLGRFVRSTSIDELPQLINVLKGDMSLIGPRPLLKDYLDNYSTFQRRRHEVKPGITGWAQINGRNNISWQKKFEMDVWYVDNVSFKLDLEILFKTILKVFKRDDISTVGEATAKRFEGN